MKKEQRLKILGLGYFGAALISLIICIWDVIVLGLFAPAVDMTHGIGVAMVCTLGELAGCALMVMIGLDLRKKFTAKTLKMGLLLVAISVFTLILSLVGAYVILPALFGMILPALTLLALK